MAVMRGNFSRGALVDPFANLMKAFGANGAMAKSMIARDQYEMDMLKDQRLVEARDIQENQFDKTQAQQLLMQGNRFGQQDKTLNQTHENNKLMTDIRHGNNIETIGLNNDNTLNRDTIINDRKIDSNKLLADAKIAAAEEVQKNKILNDATSQGYAIDTNNLDFQQNVIGKDVDNTYKIDAENRKEALRVAGDKRILDAANVAAGATSGPILSNGGPGIATGQIPQVQAPVSGQLQVPVVGGSVAAGPIMGTQQQIQSPLLNNGAPMVAPSSKEAVVGLDETQIYNQLMNKYPPQTTEQAIALKAKAKQLYIDATISAKAQNVKAAKDVNAFVEALQNTDATQQNGEAVDIQQGFSNAYDKLFASTKNPKVLQAGIKKLMKTFNQAGSRGILKDSMKARDENAQSIINQIQDPIAKAAVQKEWETQRLAVIAEERKRISGSEKKSTTGGTSSGKNKILSKTETDKKTYNSAGKVTSSTKTTNNKHAKTKPALTDKQLERRAYERRTNTKLNKQDAVRGSSGKGVGTSSTNKESGKIFSPKESTKVAASKLDTKINQTNDFVDTVIDKSVKREDTYSFNLTGNKLGMGDKINSVDATANNIQTKRNMTKILNANPQMPKKTIEDIVLWSQQGNDEEDGQMDFSSYKDPMNMLEDYISDTGSKDVHIKKALESMKSNDKSKNTVTLSTGTTQVLPGQRASITPGSDLEKNIGKADTIFTKAANSNSGKRGYTNRKLFGGSKANIAEAFDYGQSGKDNKIFVEYKGKKYTPRKIKSIFNSGKRNKDGSLFMTAREYSDLASKVKLPKKP